MERLACIDVGLKRIGLSLCLEGKIVVPQDAILRRNRDQAAHDVSSFLEEWNIDKLIVGLPGEGSSSEEMGRRIRHFVSLLSFAGKLEYMEEYGSSYEAKERMQGITKQKRDGKVDSLAAVIILERWLYALKVEKREG